MPHWSHVTAFVWSVPNYPASMPSWFNLFLATFGTLALLWGLETRRRRWMILAGVAGGVSFLFKLSGVFYLMGGGIALIATSFRPRPDGVADAGARSGAAIVTLALVLVVILLGVPISRAGVAEVVRFLVPLGVLIAALIWREWRHGGLTALARGRALLETLGPFALGALLPVTGYALFLLWMDALPQTIQGVLVTPFRRLDSGMMHPPPPSALVYTMVLGLLLVKWASGRGAMVLAIVAAAVFGAVVYASGDRPGIYARGDPGSVGAAGARGGRRCAAPEPARLEWHGSGDGHGRRDHRRLPARTCCWSFPSPRRSTCSTRFRSRWWPSPPSFARQGPRRCPFSSRSPASCWCLGSCA